jgi:glycolate oxidase FAD binding subunit
MVKQASLIDELEALAGAGNVSERRREEFAVDSVVPQAIVRPGSYEEVAGVLRYTDAGGLSVIPWGGGTMMGLGNTPRRYDIALCLSRLNAIVEHEPADLTVTCQAGISLDALREKMRESGQLAPLDPALPGSATVGGALAANAFGAYSLAYGTARDFTIGLRVVTADGRITRAGGKVVKNVAGYDLCKLYIGSLGTLGVIVEATFKLRPLARAEQRMTFPFDSPDAACALANQAYRRGLGVVAMEVRITTGGRWLLAMHFSAMPAAVERSVREVEALAGSSGGPAQEDSVPGTLQALAVRFNTLPSALPALLTQLAALTKARLVAYPTLGVARASFAAADGALLQQLTQMAANSSATMLIEACPADLKQAIDVFGGPAGSSELMRRLKQEFDPRGTLSPGRFAGKL